ncbi:MAG: 2-phospho-L-lactate/phosphoenolpyruvate guanylyltransferase [Solirubrobacteraceae bacterium]|jgi:2-phospho-L-lactate guanylyltransferase|nr:2-phospho-L-lactate/phosphoenolpyruvate guanylyltransferase [Solirubrobacteraceae bacterium]
MPETLAILPIKSFDAAKQRLRSSLNPVTRQVLVQAMFTDVLRALGHCQTIEGVIVVTGDNGAQRIAEGYGAHVVTDQQQGHNHAAGLGIDRAVEMAARAVLLVPGDCPLFDPAEIDALVTRRRPDRSVLIVPDRHGSGTNALLITPPDAFTPGFGPGSRERHEQRAAAAGLSSETVTVPSLALDVDTPEDLQQVESTLTVRHGGAAHTRGMLAQLARTGVR